MRGVAKSTTIPNYLVASTPLGLRRLMLLNNRKQSAYLEYNIMYVGDKWYAWYIADISALQNTDDPIIVQAQKEVDGGKA